MVSLYDILRGDIIPLSGLLISIGRNTYDGAAPSVPVNDIHQRSAVFYDSGTLIGSGILQYNASRRNLQLIASNSGARQIMTAVLFEVYDTPLVAGTSVTTAKTLNTFTDVRVNTHPTVYAFAGNTVQINMSGTYQMDWRVTLQNATTTLSPFSTWLEQQAPGGSFVEVSGTRSYNLLRNAATNSQASNDGSIFVPDVGPGHIFRIRSECIIAGVTANQVKDGSNFKIMRLY